MNLRRASEVHAKWVHFSHIYFVTSQLQTKCITSDVNYATSKLRMFEAVFEVGKFATKMKVELKEQLK